MLISRVFSRSPKTALSNLNRGFNNTPDFSSFHGSSRQASLLNHSTLALAFQRRAISSSADTVTLRAFAGVRETIFLKTKRLSSSNAVAVVGAAGPSKKSEQQRKSFGRKKVKQFYVAASVTLPLSAVAVGVGVYIFGLIMLG